MHTPAWLPGLLRFDAVLNWTGAVVALAAGGPIADVLGIARWPLYALAVLFLVNGAMVWRAAERPRPGLLMALAEVDFLFVAGVAAAALLLDGAENWARVALVVIAAATTVTGTAKAIGRRGSQAAAV